MASAIHDGHELRPEVAERIALSEEERRREEDPFTVEWTAVAPHRILVARSRFEVDLNRPRGKAVYLASEDAWGLRVWKEPPTEKILEESLREYDAFYAGVEAELRALERRHGRFVLFDIHSYNHRRGHAAAPPEDAAKNPEVNVGTASADRARWGGLIERFVADLRAADFMGTRLDVRENVKFFGGNFPRWVHKTFPDTGCALALEFKKIFMGEWSGIPDPRRIEAIRGALAATVPGVLEELERMGSPR
ncbi:MAG: N-formylglutamate amidohydrolase [Roseovarius sp.]|nr:N-formylglutamate amidohydrolase [Roseovarius sp.]